MANQAPDFIEGDTAKPTVGHNSLAQIAGLADIQCDLEDKIAAKTAELNELVLKYRKVSELDMPTLMGEVGMKDFTLDNGFRVKVSKEYSANISKNRAPEAFKWLRENNLGDVIKHTLVVEFPKKTGEQTVKKVMDLIRDQGFTPLTAERVHPSTLKALVREQLEEGVDMPIETFGIFKITKSIIERPTKEATGPSAS